MDLSFYPLTLEAIDQAAAESLCLFVAADERPLTGLAGLADWRLSGRLSRLLRSGLLTGDAGEAVLTPPGARLSFQKLFLFGVGKVGQTEEQLVERVSEALRKLRQAGVREAALQLPARLPVEVGIRTLLEELQGPGRAMLFSPDPQKLVLALSQAASRGSAQFEQRVIRVPTPPPVKPFSPAVKPPQRPPQTAPLTTPQSIPKAAPLPVAPASTTLPTGPTTEALPLPIAPVAAERLPTGPLPIAPVAEPLPKGPTPALPPVAAAPSPTPQPDAAKPSAASGSDAPAEEKRPALPPSQRYVPPAPKPHVFETGKRKKK